MNKQPKIELETMIVQTPGFIAADMDGEKAMMSIEKGKYYGLSTVGSSIWELVDKPVMVREVIEALLKEFDVEENICKTEVLIFLNKMVDEGLISIV